MVRRGYPGGWATPRMHPSATISPESPPAIDGESVERYTLNITPQAARRPNHIENLATLLTNGRDSSALMTSFLNDSPGLSKDDQDPEVHVDQSIDRSTVSYMFDLATLTPTGMKRCLLERHTPTHPRGLFSIRFGVIGNDDENNSRLWAQRHVLSKKAFYVISANPTDMGKTRASRSQFFLGKLKKKHNSRLFEGIYDTRHEGTRIPIVAVVYEHDRVQKDRKMEVGVPNQKGSETFMTEFSKIRFEGAQNHPSFSNIQFFHQRNDNPEYMSSSSSLNDFVIHEVAYAAVPSPKNFQLVTSTPFRTQYKDNSEAGSNEKVELTENDIALQLGKLEENLYSCIYQSPFNLLQAFMVALSRFETHQIY